MPPKAALETRKKIYEALCYVLSDRADQVAWDEYTLADWELFSQMADREGVAPLMYWKLKDSRVEVPPSTFNFLRSTHYQTLAQNTLMYQELERILRALDEAGIPVIVLKGAALAATIYEDIGLRPMRDLDLLVSCEQLAEAVRIMQSLGFRRGQPELRPGFDRLVAHNINFIDHKKIAIELHWDLGKYANWHLLPSDWFWKRSIPLRFSQALYRDGIEFSMSNGSYGLLPDAHLLYLSIHLSLGHGASLVQLLWFYDIHMMLSIFNQDINWRELIIGANQAQLLPGLVDALKGVQSRFGTELVLDLEDFSGGEGGEVKKSRLDRFRINTPRIRSEFKRLKWQSRFSLIIAYVFPTITWMRWRYKPKPSWIWPVFYPYRWIELIIRRSHVF